MMKWKTSHEVGKVSMVRWSKHHLRSKQLVITRPIGGKGSKRHLLTDGRCVPLSIVASGTHRHDVSQLEIVLDEIVIERSEDIKQNLCADKGYSGEWPYCIWLAQLSPLEKRGLFTDKF
jgi:hypothetical protein